MPEDNNEEFKFEEKNTYNRNESRMKRANLVLLIVGCALLAFVLVFSIIFICGKGFKERPRGEYERPFYYELNADGTGYDVTGMNERYKDVEIPAEYNGTPVTGIADYAFSGCGSLKSLVMPDTVTSIGAYAFENCVSLMSVTISSSVTNIGYGVFRNCRSLADVTIPDGVTRIGTEAFENCNSLIEMIVPDSVTSIGNDAFYYCSSLETVVIGGNVISVGTYAFSWCRSLTSVVIPDSVTSIGYNAFEYCYSLETVYIPDSVVSIGEDAFRDCYNLLIFAGAESEPSEWTWRWNSSGCPVYWGLSGIPTDDVTYTFKTNGGSAVASVSEPWLTALPTTTREGYIFTGWYSDPDLSGESRVAAPYYTGYDVTLYAGWIEGYQSGGLEVIDGVVTGIGTCTDSVLYISLPIGESAFYGCSQITEVYLYDGCTSIGNTSFGNCRNLRSVYFYQSEVPNIGSNVFSEDYYNSNFRVYVPSDLYVQYQNISSNGWIENIVDRGRLYTF